MTSAALSACFRDYRRLAVYVPRLIIIRQEKETNLLITLIEEALMALRTARTDRAGHLLDANFILRMIFNTERNAISVSLSGHLSLNLCSNITGCFSAVDCRRIP